MRTTLLLAALLVPRGGTEVRIPLDESTSEKAAKLVQMVKESELEHYRCACGKEHRDAWRYGACVSCGKEVKAEKKKRRLHVEVDGGALQVTTGGDFASLYVLRLSAVEKLAGEAGLKTKRAGALEGPFALHTGKADCSKLLPALRKLDGVKSAEASGGVIYVNQVRDGARVAWAAIEKLFKEHKIEIEDLSWVVNLCFGPIGFAAE